MKIHNLRLAIGFAAALVPAVARAQHQGHQPGVSQPSPEMAQCAQVQPAVNNIIVGAMASLETSRASNNPTEMRAAVDRLEAALRDIRAQLAPCAAPDAASDSHAGHTMPGMQQRPVATAPEKPSPAGASPHAGHTMPAAPASPPAAPAKATKPSVADPHAGHAKPATGATPRGEAKPETSRQERPQAADPHAGHASGRPSEKPTDPVNGLSVDPATSPKTTYEGQTYYFSSEQTRKEFLQNPAKFAKKPKR
jgi:YHS domain-containing protein